MIELVLGAIVFLFHFAYLIIYYSSFSFYDTWYFSIAMMLSGLFFYTEFKQRKKIKDWIKIDRVEILIFGCVLALGLFFINIRSVWIDEYSQYVSSNPLNDYFSLSRSAALEQQPPFGYLVTSIFTFIFGANVVGLRLSAVIFTSLTCLYLQRVLKLYQVSIPVVAIALCLYLGQSNVFNFLVEGRPYAQALFFSTFFLDYYVRLLKEVEDFSPWKFLFILYFLVCSLGLQTGILALSLFIAYAAFDRGKKSFRLLGYSTLCFILFAPILYQIFHWSDSLSQFKESIGGIDLITHGFSLSKNYWQSLIEYGPRSREVWALIIVFVISFLTSWRRAGFIALAQIILFIQFVFCFLFIINWNMYSKYYVVVTPLLIIGVALGMQFLLDKIFVFRNVIVNGLLILIVILNLFPIAIHLERTNELFVDNRDMPWKSIYAYFNRVLKEDDTVYFLTFNEPGEWVLTKPVGKEFYVGKEQDQLRGEMFIPKSFFALPSFKADNDTKGTVYLVSSINWSNDHVNGELLTENIPDLDIVHENGVRIFKLAVNDQSDNRRLINFFQTIVDLYPSYSWTYTIRASLIYLYAIEKDYARQERELRKLNEMSWPTRRALTGSWVDREELVKKITPFLSKSL